MFIPCHNLFQRELELLESRNLFRRQKVIFSSNNMLVEVDGREYINFSSNNYLGLAGSDILKKAASQALERYGVGSGASRLMSGTFSIHRELEEAISKFKKEEDAIIFTSGYMANIGVIPALVGRGDAVIVDRLNHASIIDGARMSQARIFVYPHCNTIALENVLKRTACFSKRLVVTDTLFSMDGDIAPLPQILELCEKYRSILMVDEAHATGIFGRRGSGLVEEFGLSGKIDVVMGTMSKALGTFGGYVAGSRIIIEYLRQRVRTFIYTTSLPLPLAASCIKAIEYIENNGEERESFWKRIEYVRSEFLKMGYDLLNSKSQIIPVVIGPVDKAMEIERYLFEQGIFALAIRPPTVPKDSSRFRITISSSHREEDIQKLLHVFREIKRRFF